MKNTFENLASFYNSTTDVRDTLKNATRLLGDHIRIYKVRWQDIHSFECTNSLSM